MKNKEKDVDGIANHQQPHQYIQHNHHSKNTSIQIIYIEKSNTEGNVRLCMPYQDTIYQY